MRIDTSFHLCRAAAVLLCVSASPVLACTGISLHQGEQVTCTVPAGVHALAYEVVGGDGGYSGPPASFPASISPGGRGARITGPLFVTPGQTLYLSVGSNGGNFTVNLPVGGGGGGYSAIAQSGYTADPLVVAAGGGGGGAAYIYMGDTYYVPGGNAGEAGSGGAMPEYAAAGGQPGTGSAGGAGGSAVSQAAAGGAGGAANTAGSGGAGSTRGGGGGGGGFGAAGGPGGGFVGNGSAGGINGGGGGGSANDSYSPAGGGGGGGYAGGGGGGNTEVGGGGGGGGSSLIAAGGIWALGDGGPRIVLSLATVPDAPPLVTAAPGDAQAVLTWTAPASGSSPISSYAITVDPPDGTCTPTPDTATRCTATGLTNGRTYTFTVAARSAVGTGPATASNPATPVIAPSVVAATASEVAATTAVLNGSVDALGADVGVIFFRYGADPVAVLAGGGAQASATPASVAVADGPTPVRANISGLAPETTYYVRLYATNAIGTTVMSNLQAFDTVRANCTEIHLTVGRQTCVVPAGVQALVYEAVGANGGSAGPTPVINNGGLGARLSGVLPVTPGQMLYLSVGGNGAGGSSAGATGGGGGGYSSIAQTSYTADPLVVAAGGGGGGGGAFGGAGGPGGSAGAGPGAGQAGTGDAGGAGGAGGGVNFGAGGTGGAVNGAGANGAAGVAGGGGGGGGFSATGGPGGPGNQGSGGGGAGGANGGGGGGGTALDSYRAGGGGGGGYTGGGGGAGGNFGSGGGGGGFSLMPAGGTSTAGDGTPRIVLALASAPGAPTGVTATPGAPGSGEVSVTWTAPANHGSHPITGYTATANGYQPPAFCTTTGSPPATSCTMQNLPSPGWYAFVATATNDMGTSSVSDIAGVFLKGAQAKLSLVANPALLVPGNSSELTVSGGSGEGALTYAVDSGPCSVAGNLATAVGIGTCSVRATKAGDANYGPASAATTITVNAAPPVALPQSVSARFNEPTPITLGATDANPGGPFNFTYAIATPPAHGSVELVGGIATYTPTAGTVGSDSFTFTATTVHGTSAPATVSLTIAAGQPVEATPQSVTVPFNTAQPITLSGTDANPGGPFTFAYALAAPPTHGTISGFDAGTGALTYAPDSDYSGEDSFTFTVNTVNGISQPATVSMTIDAAPPRLALSISDAREYVRYGQIVDYTVTLTNAGGAEADVSVEFSLSDGFDGDHVLLACFGADGGASCVQDAFDPLRFIVMLPADRSLIWRISVSVRSDAEGASVDFGATATGATPATDTSTLVIHRDGFDTLDGDGTRSVPVVEGAQAKAILDGDVLHEVEVPGMPSNVATVLLIVREGPSEVRVEGSVTAGVALVRLLERDAEGRERATAWSGTHPDAMLTLGSLLATDGAPRAVVLIGARMPLALHRIQEGNEEAPTVIDQKPVGYGAGPEPGRSRPGSSGQPKPLRPQAATTESTDPAGHLHVVANGCTSKLAGVRPL